MATYRTSKSFTPGAGFNNSVGKQRNATTFPTAPKGQDAPQSREDQQPAGSNGTLSVRSWLRGGRQNPNFDYFKK